MKFRDWAFLLGTAGAATLVYGALYEANNLKVEQSLLMLKDWPERLYGYKIVLLADLHLRDKYSLALAKRAVAEALDAEPDMVVLGGDLVGYWKPESVDMLGEALEPLLLMNGSAIAVPGNHEYWGGDAELLAPILGELNIKYLRNQNWKHDSINWIGIDSAVAGRARPEEAIKGVGDGPRVILWHEPDPVDTLDISADLQLSGHSHGGQFRLPNGWAPMHTRGGEKYVEGFYPDAHVPLYVSRGIGTTGPPSRLFCAPEVSVLTLIGD